MTVDERVRIAIGDLTVQLCAAHARIEDLEAQLKDRVEAEFKSASDPE